MTQHKPPQAMTLFDLIARTWALGTGVRGLHFNAKGSALTVMMEDGRLAFLSVKDAESPDSRVRVEADTGRPTIRPRTKPLPVPIVSESPVATTDVVPCRLGEQGLAFANADTGALWRATARGQTLAMTGAPTGTVTALAGLTRAGHIVVAQGKQLSLLAEEGGVVIADVKLPHTIKRIAVSKDGKRLACWGAGKVSIVTSEDLSAEAPIACDGEVLDLNWSPCQRWLVAGCKHKAVLLVDVAQRKSDKIVDFPADVHTTDFCEPANAMVASGAFRVVGWTLPDLPFGTHSGAPIETGKPGLTLVDRVAVHPTRDLCAVSYANGLVMLCRVGHPDEMLVREGTGATVAALAWSDDGAHLAIGGKDGDLSIVTFPKNMFK